MWYALLKCARLNIINSAIKRETVQGYNKDSLMINETKLFVSLTSKFHFRCPCTLHARVFGHMPGLQFHHLSSQRIS